MGERKGRRLSTKDAFVQLSFFVFVLVPFMLYSVSSPYGARRERRSDVISCSPPLTQSKNKGRPDSNATGCHAPLVIINHQHSKYGKAKATEHSCDLG